MTTGLQLTQAQALVKAAIDHAEREYQRPVCVSICDVHGDLMAFGRADGAPLRSVQIAQGKAYTSARLGVPTHVFLKRLQKEKLQARDFCDDKLTAMPGGEPLKDTHGSLLGGIGVSGLTPDEDSKIASVTADGLSATPSR